jgi:hypothetical protein
MRGVSDTLQRKIIPVLRSMAVDMYLQQKTSRLTADLQRPHLGRRHVTKVPALRIYTVMCSVYHESHTQYT